MTSGQILTQLHFFFKVVERDDATCFVLVFFTVKVRGQWECQTPAVLICYEISNLICLSIDFLII